MAVGFNVDFYWFQIGSSDFLYSFFSTVAYRLENNIWGSKYPIIMKDLYYGKILIDSLDDAIIELSRIKDEFSRLKPESVIWSIDDLSIQPPWGNDISSDIADMSNYYVTSDGRDFFDVFLLALTTAKELKKPLEIEAL